MFRQEDKELMGATLKSAVGSIGMLLAAWFFLIVLGTAYAYYLGFLVSLGALWDAYLVWTKQLAPSPKRVFTKALSTFALLYNVWILNYYLGAYGLAGFILLILILAGITLYRRRTLYVWWLRHIERRFLGMTAEERKKQREEE